MGEFLLRQADEQVMQGEFCHSKGPVAVRCSYRDFGLVVQPLDDTAGELLFCSDVVEQQLAVPAYDAREPLDLSAPAEL